MERGSSKHGRHVDEEMARQARSHIQGGGAGGSRTEEWREPEPSGKDQPESTLIPAGQRPGGAPAPMTRQQVEARSELGRWVPRSRLPADRDALVRAAQESGAPEPVLAELSRLPRGETFETVAQAWAALGYPNEGHRW